VPFVRWCGKIW